MGDKIGSHLIDVVILRRSRWKARVYECKWRSAERHYGEVEGRRMIRCTRGIPLEVQRVDEEGIALWPRVVIVFNEGKLGTSETAKVVDSSESALPNHVLEEDSGCEIVRNLAHSLQSRRQFAN